MSKTQDIEDKIASITEENPFTIKESLFMRGFYSLLFLLALVLSFLAFYVLFYGFGDGAFYWTRLLCACLLLLLSFLATKNFYKYMNMKAVLYPNEMVLYQFRKISVIKHSDYTHFTKLYNGNLYVFSSEDESIADLSFYFQASIKLGRVFSTYLENNFIDVEKEEEVEYQERVKNNEAFGPDEESRIAKAKRIKFLLKYILPALGLFHFIWVYMYPVPYAFSLWSCVLLPFIGFGIMVPLYKKLGWGIVMDQLNIFVILMPYVYPIMALLQRMSKDYYFPDRSNFWILWGITALILFAFYLGVSRFWHVRSLTMGILFAGGLGYYLPLVINVAFDPGYNEYRSEIFIKTDSLCIDERHCDAECTCKRENFCDCDTTYWVKMHGQDR